MHLLPSPKALQTWPASQPPWTFPRRMTPESCVRTSTERVPEGSNRGELQPLQTSTAGTRGTAAEISRQGAELTQLCCHPRPSTAPRLALACLFLRLPLYHRCGGPPLTTATGAFRGTGGSLRGSGSLSLAGAASSLGSLPPLPRDSGALSTLRQDKGRLPGE